jgi:signal transduction histidine kinase
VLIGLVGLIATVLLWHALRKQEAEQIHHAVALVMASVRADMVSDVESRIQPLAQMAKVFHLVPNQKASFRLHASIYLAHHPECWAIAWLDGRKRFIDIFPAGTALQIAQIPALGESLDSARLPDSVVVTPALNRGRTVMLIAPVENKRGPRESIVAVFDAQKLLEAIVADHANLGYSIRVTNQSQLMFVLSDLKDQMKEWSNEASVVLPGTTWNLEILPTPRLLAEMKSRLPEVLFLGGLAFVLLMVLTICLARTCRYRQKEVETANSRLLQLQEEERRRIARELHETFAQDLCALTMKLNLLQSLMSSCDPAACELVKRSVEVSNQCLLELRTLSYLLHPPSLERINLRSALQIFVKGFSERSGISASLEIPADFPPLPGELENALFRIVQEALINVHRHSGSKTARVRMTRDRQEVTLEVIDNGRGIPKELMGSGEGPVGAGVGIDSMRERARQLGGGMRIFSSESGTRLCVILPIPAKPEKNRKAGLVSVMEARGSAG